MLEVEPTGQCGRAAHPYSVRDGNEAVAVAASEAFVRSLHRIVTALSMSMLLVTQLVQLVRASRQCRPTQLRYRSTAAGVTADLQNARYSSVELLLAGRDISFRRAIPCLFLDVASKKVG